MIVNGPRITENSATVELSAQICSERFPFRSHRIWWRFPAGFAENLRISGDFLVPALLLPCMAQGEPLTVEAPVSPRLMRAIPDIQCFYMRCMDNLRSVEVSAPIIRNVPETRAGVGCFFTGGVDSFYSLLKNQQLPMDDPDRLTHLLFVVGFDLPARETRLLRQVRANLSRVAESTGHRYLEIWTNLRNSFGRWLPWDYYHGAALASTALACGSTFRKVLIPTSNSYDDMILWGSHPDLDSLWSTEDMIFINDGHEAKRSEKVSKWICRSELALQNLRVCWKNYGQKYNCGVCEKCLRTLLALYLGTGRTDFPCFSRPLIPENLRRVTLKDATYSFGRENLEGLTNRHTEFDQRLKDALRHIIESYERPVG